MYEISRLVTTAKTIKLNFPHALPPPSANSPNVAQHITNSQSPLMSGWLVAVNKEAAYRVGQRARWYETFLPLNGSGVPDGGWFHRGL